ncbi:ribonuclease H-like superfamily protein, partial [Striga asiatica]
MCNSGLCWDENLVRILFRDSDASEILNIRGLNPRGEDLWLCHFSVKGNFSVHAAYHSMINEKICVVSEDRIQLTTYILWWLWRARNLWIFEQTWQTEREILKAAARDWGGNGKLSSSDESYAVSLCIEFG